MQQQQQQQQHQHQQNASLKHTESPKHVHFSEKNQEFLIPNKEQDKEDMLKENNLALNQSNTNNNLFDDIFIVNPMEIKNTSLTLSENEYFNNM
jgi:hypothetical protein